MWIWGCLPKGKRLQKVKNLRLVKHEHSGKGSAQTARGQAGQPGEAQDPRGAAPRPSGSAKGGSGDPQSCFPCAAAHPERGKVPRPRSAGSPQLGFP